MNADLVNKFSFMLIPFIKAIVFPIKKIKIDGMLPTSHHFYTVDLTRKIQF